MLTSHQTCHTADEMIRWKWNLLQVAAALRDARTTEEHANTFFRSWCVGKGEYRWNDGAARPEERSARSETWHPMRWSSVR